MIIIKIICIIPDQIVSAQKWSKYDTLKGMVKGLVYKKISLLPYDAELRAK